ncbi:MAG: lysophospholipid acyltransferase family protein [Oligoflexia bacterium]|nr:lysophospholipid acyltransferase family protein [Oligoflexia bacterium]
MFYIQMLLCTIWFFFCCFITLFVAIIRWRHPSNGYFCSVLFTNGTKLITGLRIKIHNKERLRATQPCIYLGNHQSNVDILVHADCYPPRTIAIGKKELLWIPLFGFLFYLCRNILLDRKDHSRAVEGLNQAKDYLMNKNISIYMFPEGTRNRGAKKLLPFKKGAFHMAILAGVPVLPVVASHIDTLVDFKAKKIHPGTFNVEVLEPIPTKGLTIDDIDTLMQTTYERMQSAYERLKSERFSN